MNNRITAATFSACITSKDALPKDDLPIIALVGRSNVGKSSLINSLTGRKELARTSSMPGKTLTINFYCINDSFYLVDLPGYGYAKASKTTRAKIQMMMDEFFQNCSNLKGIAQIVDIRHKPSTLDIQMHNWIKEQHFNGFVVLTKSDKLSNQQCAKMKSAISKDLRNVYLMTYSSKSLNGRDEFLDAIEKIIAGYEFKVIEPQRSKVLPDSDKNPESESNTKRPSLTGETPGHQQKNRNTDDSSSVHKPLNKNREGRLNNKSFNKVRRDNHPRKNNDLRKGKQEA